MGKYIKEARGKFTQYKSIHRLGILADVGNVRQRQEHETGIVLHTLWQSKYVNPF